jgi:hypothetical protein
MATQPLSSFGLKLQLEAKSNGTIVHCKGKISEWNRLGYGNNAIQKVRVDVH